MTGKPVTKSNTFTTATCGNCGQVWELDMVEYDLRRKRNVYPDLYCSQKCAGQWRGVNGQKKNIGRKKIVTHFAKSDKVICKTAIGFYGFVTSSDWAEVDCRRCLKEKEMKSQREQHAAKIV